MDERLARARELWHRIHDLTQIQSLLDWDQQTMMPRQGAEQRSQQLAALAAVLHERLVAPELGELIAELESAGTADEELAADLRDIRRDRARALRLPERLVAERARVCALAQAVWTDARRQDDFALFQPHLEAVVSILRETAAALQRDGATLYDGMLEEYEPGMGEAALQALFATLAPALRALAERCAAAPQPPVAQLPGPFPVPTQQAFVRAVVAEMGFSFEAGRLDCSAHPFTTGTLYDVRITNRYREDEVAPAIFGAIHEAGHALYQQGLDPRRYREPAGAPCSFGIHESQSRLWENLIARSRGFWRFYLPRLQQAFPSLGAVTLEDFYRAINRVRPSLIRVEADEVTYNLHIVLRFELECALLSGELSVAELPGIWRERMAKLLGIVPPTDREGVLQDVHWAAGLFGYFPTYALGNLYAAQLFEAMRRELPDLDAGLSRGELHPVKRWLNERVHRQGRRLLAPELCRHVTGQALSPAAALRYLEGKYAEIYGG